MDGIIFDVDGTLWDSTEAVARSWNQAIEENTDFSLSLTADRLKSLFGKTMDEITLAQAIEERKLHRDDLIAQLRQVSVPQPGVLPVLPVGGQGGPLHLRLRGPAV